MLTPIISFCMNESIGTYKLCNEKKYLAWLLAMAQNLSFNRSTAKPWLTKILTRFSMVAFSDPWGWVKHLSNLFMFKPFI